MTASTSEIRSFLKELERAEWLRDTERYWWPRFLFHYTDIHNAIQILTDGRLYSRSRAEQLQKLALSSGSRQVLEYTNPEIRDCVRFYFRPKTPTQYQVEGVHSKSSLVQSAFPDAHCPVPVFLLFDAAAVLALPKARFSDRGLGGKGYRLGDSLEALKNLPWPKIYHNRWLDPQMEREIIACRNAEVIVPKEVSLDALQGIFCRSEAEKDTLLHLLPQAQSWRYRDKISATLRHALFFRQRTFVEEVSFLPDISVYFSPDTRCPGPFHLQIEVEGKTLADIKNYVMCQPFVLSQSLKGFRKGAEVRITLDGCLIYAGAIREASETA